MAKVPKVAKKYTAGLKESTAAKRKAEIRKRVQGKVSQAEMEKPLPGDKTAKTKPSKYTRKAGELRKDILERASKMRTGKQNERFVRAVAIETGIPQGIIQEVFDKGLAAWKVGHRPGATPAQWAKARVYSFLTGGKTTTTADATLFAKAKKAIKGKTGFKLP
jgi:hypothetical protein